MATDLIPIEFLDCTPGKEYVKLLDWPYPSKSLLIEREKTTYPGEWMFDVTEEPPPARTLKITYKPVLPFTEDYDYFQITTATLHTVKLNLKGSTLGPKVVFKPDQLVFNCKDSQAMKRIISMKNEGTMETLYCFDLDNNNSDVTISPHYGNIEKGATIKLMVTFQPKRAAFVFRKIYCIVHHQEPIILTIRANYMKESAFAEFDDFINFQEPLPYYPNRYEEYIQDVASILFVEKPPLVTLDRKYIDFGMVDPTKGGLIASEQFSITNNSNVKLCLMWLLDEKNVFKIDPPKEYIENNCTMSFRARFSPCFPDEIHSAKITGGIYWGTNDDFAVPHQVSIDLLGHTFTVMRTGWDPFFKFSNKAILPATIPCTPCFGTYKLLNTGQFPIMFKFIPPDVSNLLMKPLHGLIEGESHQIFTLRFLPGVKADITYNEKWILQINIFQKLEVEFSITANVLYLTIGDNKPIKFPPTSLNSDVAISVSVKNNTRLKTKFSLFIPGSDSPFYIENPVQYIGPNELTFITMHFNPRNYGKVEQHVTFDMEFITSFGHKHLSSNIVKIKGACTDVLLKAMPSSLYLGETLMGSWIYGIFKIKNIGNCDALLDTEGMPRSPGDEDVITKIEPKSFIIPAMSKLTVTVGVCPQEVGFKRMKVVYYLCTDNTLTKHVEETPTSLMTFEVNCSAPKLEIIDIRVARQHLNLSKYFMWEKLQINKLNEALGKLKFKPEEEETPVYMKLPVGALKRIPLQVDLLVKNKSPHEALLDIKFEKICNCKPVIEDVSISLRRTVIKCQHEEQITFLFEKHVFKPKEEGIVTIKCIYTNHSRKTFKFILSVKAVQDESICGYIALWFERICCKPGVNYLGFDQPTSLATTVLIDACPVFVGDPCKPMQVIWTYNNFSEEIPYDIKRHSRDELEVFKFPQTKGVISAHSAHPLVYKFTPYQYKTYTKTFDLITPHVTYVLHLTGKGSIAPCYNTFSMLHKVPSMSLFNQEKEEVEISLDNIALKPMLLHSTEKRLVFLKNNMSEDVEFHWATRRVGAMFNVRAIPDNGVLKPNQLKPIQIIIQSLSVPSRLTIFITCKFLHLQSALSYASRVENMKKYGKIFDLSFSLSEHPAFSPVPVTIEGGQKVYPKYFNITISVHSISERFLDDIIPNTKHQMKMLTQTKIETNKNISVALTRKEADVCIDTFTRVLWEILNRKIFLESVSHIKPTSYYKDIAKAEKIMPIIEPPKSVILNVLNSAIFKSILKMFTIKSNSTEETMWAQETTIVPAKEEEVKDNENKEDDKNKEHNEDKENKEQKMKTLITEHYEKRNVANKYYRNILQNGSYNTVSSYNINDIYGRSNVFNVSKRNEFLKALRDLE